MEDYQQAIQRPWQGTVLGVLNIVALVFSGLIILVLIIALLFGASFIAPYLDNIQMPVNLGVTAIIAIVLAFVIPFSILYIFVTIGIFKGAKWALIVHLILSILGITGNISSFHIFGLAVQILIIYCCIVCLGHPFYNRRVLL